MRSHRLGSTRKETRELTATPYLFGENRQPSSAYLFVPRVSSELREFIPVGFASADVIAGDSLHTIPNATRFHFAVLNSTMHNAWTRAVCGRLESRYRYSATIVYNNFPWPNANERQRQAMDRSAEEILGARAAHSEVSPGALYKAASIPADLREAHAVNDAAVDAAFGYRGDGSDATRVAFLFELYGRMIAQGGRHR